MQSASGMKLFIILMQEAIEEAMDVNCRRKLDLNLPLLSTRRLGCHIGEETAGSTISHLASRDMCNGIPFCWEQAPGKPKDIQKDDINTSDTPRPKLPPCRWQPQKEATKNDDTEKHAASVDEHDDGCDADVDEGDNDNNVFSDAIDVLSLTEATDIVPDAQSPNLQSVKSTDVQSPNFMIERFLPDATALAASSALCELNNLNQKKYPYPCNVSRTVGRSYSSESLHKGCGPENLFSWRMNHKLCGVKSPVREAFPNVQQTQRTAKQKKHCSTIRPFQSVNRTIFDV